ncbi:MAG: CRISPR-associated protein Csx3 [Candidatus Scalindua sp.]|nr:CRISPR-associated protein Csx3 [Candidatus Scalindua sp.]
MRTITINLNSLFDDQAKIDQLPEYMSRCIEFAGDGNDIVLTGAAPVWLYLKIAHSLHGKARKLTYRSPVTGDVEIFNHNPL